ncbi:hypothetical protein [Desulfosporosinus sp. FKA]|uniref:hypothetical protein n=1 Tax=Desulfosporosinus sp. FKA TaxID=1969834 RepID=UPI000B498C1A|nr:hypothetical protein [Desulfosporosinus sp. FKA]
MNELMKEEGKGRKKWLQQNFSGFVAAISQSRLFGFYSVLQFLLSSSVLQFFSVHILFIQFLRPPLL